MAETINHSEGGGLFGRLSDKYVESRPEYAAHVFDVLRERCGLCEGCATLEVGPGSGLATVRLLEFGARPLVLVEPDRGFSPLLDQLADASGDVTVKYCRLEDADLDHWRFDLVVCATSMHWLEPDAGLAKLGHHLRPGGALAAFWHSFGDPGREDPFHEATFELLGSLAASPSNPSGALPFALDVGARQADFQRAGAGADFYSEKLCWTLVLTPSKVRALYSTFSSILRLDVQHQVSVLDELEQIAEREFGGRVERNMVTSIYTGRRGNHDCNGSGVALF